MAQVNRIYLFAYLMCDSSRYAFSFGKDRNKNKFSNVIPVLFFGLFSKEFKQVKKN